MARKNISSKEYARLFALRYRQQKGKCIWCGDYMYRWGKDPVQLIAYDMGVVPAPPTWREDKKRLKRQYASLEHLLPLSRGGTHESKNIVLAHRKCNGERASHMHHVPHPTVLNRLPLYVRKHMNKIGIPT